MRTMINMFLDGVEGAKSRISKASKPMGALKFVWDGKDVPLETKIKSRTSTHASLSS